MPPVYYIVVNGSADKENFRHVVSSSMNYYQIRRQYNQQDGKMMVVVV